MIEAGERLPSADLARIARLHVVSIADSIPTMLGAGYATAFFRYLARAPHEHLFVERLEGRIQSACVVSLAPDTVYRRTLRATWLRLAPAAALALRGAPFRRFVVRFASDLLHGAAGQPHAPEITYIFTNPELRSRGLGGRLLTRVERFLRARGVPRYFVRTIDEPSNRALGFYAKQGFQRIGRQLEGGRPFAVFEKPLPASARVGPHGGLGLEPRQVRGHDVHAERGHAGLDEAG
jgi:ribosomal protein S18 acetylase RimI-like enzyme